MRRAETGAARKPASGAVRTVRGPQRERHEPDYLIVVSVVAMAAIGLVMVYSSSGAVWLLAGADPLAVVGPQAFWAVLGALAMVIVMRLDYRHLRAISVPGYVFALVLLVLVLLPPIGPIKPIEEGGSMRWLQIGPLPRMHPAEFAKLALVIYLAHWLARKGTNARSLTNGLVPFLVITGPLLGLVLLEPDLGTTGVLTLTAVTIFFVAGGSVVQLMALAPLGVAGLAWAVTQSSYQYARVQAFLDPWADPQGIGFHTVQGLLALGAGGLFGMGLGESRQPGALHLPNAQNDFVFAVVAQELGFVGAITLIGIYVLFAYRGIRVALSAPDTFGALLATGITAWLTLQAFINIGVVVVLIPITGITLPFVSAGGSSLLVSFAAVGVLLSISRETVPSAHWKDADTDRGRWYRRTRLPRPGRRSLPARAGT